jgi:hypothetical protein
LIPDVLSEPNVYLAGSFPLHNVFVVCGDVLDFSASCWITNFYLFVLQHDSVKLFVTWDLIARRVIRIKWMSKIAFFVAFSLYPAQEDWLEIFTLLFDQEFIIV